MRNSSYAFNVRAAKAGSIDDIPEPFRVNFDEPENQTLDDSKGDNSREVESKETCNTSKEPCANEKENYNVNKKKIHGDDKTIQVQSKNKANISDIAFLMLVFLLFYDN